MNSPQLNSGVSIVIDAMGGDYAPGVNIDGALLALNDDPEIKLQLVGDRSVLLKSLANHGVSESDRLQVIHAEEVITMEDTASQGIEKRKNPASTLAYGR